MKRKEEKAKEIAEGLGAKMDIGKAKQMIKEYTEKNIDEDIWGLGSEDHPYYLPSFETTIGEIRKAFNRLVEEGTFD